MRGLKKTSQCTSAPAWGARGGAGSEAKGKSAPTRPRCQAGWEQAGRSSGKAGTRLPPEGHVYEGVEGQKVGAHEEKGSAGGMQTGAGARRDAQTPGRQTQRGGQQEGVPDSLHCNSQREPLSRERRPLVSWVSEQKPDCVQREMAGVSNQVGVSAR